MPAVVTFAYPPDSGLRSLHMLLGLLFRGDADVALEELAGSEAMPPGTLIAIDTSDRPIPDPSTTPR